MTNYYELKYLVTETFYENIIDEGYTIGQSVGRCCVEFYDDISSKEVEALIVYSTIFSRVAKYEKNRLKDFKGEIDEMNNMIKGGNFTKKLKQEEVDALKEDINFINSKNKF